MDLVTTGYGWEFLFRWMHFMAGIAWIGMLYYFNLVQTPFFATELGGQAKSAMTRGLVPAAMWWFRWGAMFTFGTGWLDLCISWTASPQRRPITRASRASLGTLMLFNVVVPDWPARDFGSRTRCMRPAARDPRGCGQGRAAGRISRRTRCLDPMLSSWLGRHMRPASSTARTTRLLLLALAVIALSS